MIQKWAKQKILKKDHNAVTTPEVCPNNVPEHTPALVIYDILSWDRNTNILVELPTFLMKMSKLL